MSGVSESKMVVSADGTEIYANAVGDPSHPALVFLHGFSTSTLVFDAIFDSPKWSSQLYLVRASHSFFSLCFSLSSHCVLPPYLPPCLHLPNARMRTLRDRVRYDMRGHGRSGKPVDEASWESRRLCDDFDAVLQAFNVQKPIVVGWSLGATNITDILSFHPPSYLAGIIYVSALPYMGPVMAKVGTPDILGCLPALMQMTDVDAFQNAAISFIDRLSSSMSHNLRQACLGNYMVQPRAVTLRLLTRVQSEVGLLEAGRNGGLPMLAVISKKDQVVFGEETLKAVDGWKNLHVEELDNGDHMPWLSEEVAFRDAVLSWAARIFRGSNE
ncbi:AB hydrolase superfamily protein [Pleurotus pulmonarius]